jgi:Uma2 family endonuclease
MHRAERATEGGRVVVTALVLGPTDRGRPMTRHEFETARGQEGYYYELIDGKVYVSPAPNLPHDIILEWLLDILKDYSRAHPEILNYVSPKARAHVPGREAATSPEPDLAAYRDFPRHLPIREQSWESVSPILVVEIVSEDDPEKDLERNVELYVQVPSIREYWTIDPRADPDHPAMTVYRRRGRRWQNPIVVRPGETYTTKLLPGLALVVDPRAGE